MKVSFFSFGIAVSFRLLNVMFREIRNIRNWILSAKTSFAKHEISRNREHFFREIRNSSRMKFARFSYEVSTLVLMYSGGPLPTYTIRMIYCLLVSIFSSMFSGQK